MKDKKFRLNKKDFIPIYGMIKYYNRTMPKRIDRDTSFEDNLKIKLNDFALGLYNVGVIGVANIAIYTAAVGLEAFLK